MCLVHFCRVLVVARLFFVHATFGSQLPEGLFSAIWIFTVQGIEKKPFHVCWIEHLGLV